MAAKISSALSTSAIVLGLLICFVPFVLPAYSSWQMSQSLSSASLQMQSVEEDKLAQTLANAAKWNEQMAAAGGLHESLPGYEEQLNVLANGVMGILHIPCIDLQLPIYHGCEQLALSTGAGHWPQSSLPVGGKSTRAVLTSHSGLASASLFTRLDELKEGDLFWIENPKETLVYQVSAREVISPEEANRLKIVPDEDLVTLMTCTPYGINSHRLLVTGSRIALEEEVLEAESARWPSWRTMLISAWPFVLLMIASGLWWRWRHGRRKQP